MSWWLFSLACGLAYWRGSWRWLLGGLIGWGLWLSQQPSLALKCSQRWDTYLIAVKLSMGHPFLGVGAGPLALPTLCQVSGMPLPGPHSDWLAGLILHGWIATGIAMWLVARLLRHRRDGDHLMAQSALLTLLVMAAGRSMVVHPGYVLAVLLCSGYLLLKERA